MGSNGSAFTTGYYLGSFALLLTLFVIYRFVGRWGWVGVVIRIVCVGLGILKILSMVANPPPS